jgi:glycosyltransferase involved in cell wall biosynthesis
LHVLVLIDRDWTHPQAGGSGDNLLQHVREFVAQGHRVTVVTSAYPGAAPVERDGAVTILRRGGPYTVFAHAVWRVRRGDVPDADVVLEVLNGVTYLTPLWLRLPAVRFVHHLSRGDQYVAEFGPVLGRLLGVLLETGPLRLLYRGKRFTTVSEATKAQLTGLGIPAASIEVNHPGLRPDQFAPSERAPVPSLISVGRIKRYKRVDLLLDLVERLPEVSLDVVGHGDHTEVLATEIAERGLQDRVRLRGFVEEQEKLALLASAWALVTASSAEGWGAVALEAAACGTPTVALRVGGLAEAVLHERTGSLADGLDDLEVQVRRIVEDPQLRDRLGAAALERARGLTWTHTAGRTLALLEDERATWSRSRWTPRSRGRPAPSG